jgi:polyketide biosynthesis enoyl-CoA hydratase PksH
MYQLWLRMVNAPFITISVVRGRANAGGIGFVAASDIVLADQSARFSLSELLFGLYPSCVLPFLVRRTGVQHAHYMTLMTQPFTAQQVQSYGLVDALDDDAGTLLNRHLVRLRRLARPAIGDYKRYMANAVSGVFRSCASQRRAPGGNRRPVALQ